MTAPTAQAATGRAQANITPELIRAALAYIPATLPRDEWARVAMAIKSEFPDTTGLDLFTDWSASAEGYDPKATRSTWRSVKAGGGVGIGTLLHLAKANGFTLPKADQALTPPSPEALAQRAQDRKAAHAAEQASTVAAHADAAAEAATQWGAASEAGSSPYLVRKGVQPYGVRFESDGWLLVPLRDTAGKLWNLQRIAADKPTNGGSDKLFLKGGRKSGLLHWLGPLASPGAVPGDDAPTPAVILICEGYATGASLHEATGRPVAVAFDAGNLAHVSKALREQFPAALLVLAGDDDSETFAKRGNNPGRDKATEAARAVRGLAVFPEGLPDVGSDFNDLHLHIGGAVGLDAVRRIVQGAIDAHRSSQNKPHATPDKKTVKGTTSPRDGHHGPENANPYDRFAVDDEGVWYTPPGDDGGVPRKVCGPLRVTGMACNAMDNQAALMLEFDTAHKKGRRWLMPLAMLAGDGSAYRSMLLSQGFITPTDSKRRGWLTEYLQSRPPAELVRHVSRVGWHGRCYVLPNETLGENPQGERVIFHSEAGIEANFNQRGELAQWQQDLSRLCVGNTRAAFAVATAFAGPLLVWAPGTTGGGFHSIGPTSIGLCAGVHRYDAGTARGPGAPVLHLL